MQSLILSGCIFLQMAQYLGGGGSRCKRLRFLMPWVIAMATTIRFFSGLKVHVTRPSDRVCLRVTSTSTGRKTDEKSGWRNSYVASVMIDWILKASASWTAAVCGTKEMTSVSSLLFGFQWFHSAVSTSHQTMTVVALPCFKLTQRVFPLPGIVRQKKCGREGRWRTPWPRYGPRSLVVLSATAIRTED